MNKSNEPDDVNINLTQAVVAVVLSGVMVYLGIGLSMYISQPPEKKSIGTFLFPFRIGPSAQELHKKGVKQLNQKNHRKAIRFFEKSLKRNSSNPKGVFLMASAWAKLGNFQKALNQLELVEEAKPDFSRVHIKKAYWLLGMGLVERAKQSANKYLEMESVEPSNKVYGHLVRFVADRLKGRTTNFADLKESMDKLEINENSWGIRLLDELTSNDKNYDKLDYGQQTEVRAWLAILRFAEGDTNRAQKQMNWVLKKGDDSRYEYDMMLALREVGFTSDPKSG